MQPAYMAEFSFQREWVERRGFFLVLAFFLGGLGSGLYLVSLYFDFYAGLVTGFLIVAVGKSGAHLIYLGKPWRFWRGFLRPQTSWISRGLLAIALFLVFAALQLAPTVPQLSWLPWTADNLAIQTLAIIGAVAVMAYTGFALGVVNAIPAWNTALMPILFMAYSLLGGSGLALSIVSASQSPIDSTALEMIATWLLIFAAMLMGIYLWVTYYTTTAGKRSVVELIKGKASIYFVVGVAVLGIVIPLCIAGYALINEVPRGVLLVGAICELVGGFSMRYSILKAGIYAPLI